MKNIVIFAALLTITISCNMKQQETNPLLATWDTPHQTPPFAKIGNNDYMPAFTRAMELGRKEITSIVENDSKPTFENTIEAMERAGKDLNRVSSVFFNLLSAETNDSMQTIAQEISPLLTAYSNDISLNPKLFERVKAVYQDREKLYLKTEQAKLLDDSYKGFVRNGANLSDADKEIYRNLSTELSTLSLKFSDNVLKETNNYTLNITQKSELSGLPEWLLEATAEKAKSTRKEGWLIDITMPIYQPFMQYCDNRELRKTIYFAYMSKGNKENEFNNRQNVKRIAELRLQIANLLGFKTYADFVLEERMALNSANVYKLLDDLYLASMNTAKNELAEITTYAKELGFKAELMPWDFSYYSEKLKENKYAINDEMLKPYFELSKVESGVFGLATDLFGITFNQNKDIPVYHPEVKAYDVLDKDGKFLSVLYTDFHPRPGKRGGAWMNSIKDQWIDEEGNSRPQIIIVMNFTRPTASKPALLTFGEVETFLHEFGHALHGMFANSMYQSQSGTNVYRDFVELPSQIMENWATEKEFLDKFAMHYQTGEKIPQVLIDKIVLSSNYLAGYTSVRQLSFGYLDMAWHTLTEPYLGDVKTFEDKAWEKTILFGPIPGICMSTQFGHLFSGGYAAGYYSYKWAEVLDADAFALFKEKGLFDKEIAQRFRSEILAKGGTEHPMTLYKRFRGSEPTTDALLIRSGLKK